MHCDEQQSLDVVHVEPSFLQLTVSGAHAGGRPVHLSAQQSDEAEQAPPSGAQGALQTLSPPAFGEHAPWQQSSSSAQGEPFSRHGPGPSMQLPESASQVSPQHGVATPAPQLSPVGLHGARRSRMQVPPPGGHVPLQQSPGAAHGWPTCAHTAEVQTPPWQPVEQQSNGIMQGAPTGRQ
jgi:hypothetical protein